MTESYLRDDKTHVRDDKTHLRHAKIHLRDDKCTSVQQIRNFALVNKLMEEMAGSYKTVKDSMKEKFLQKILSDLATNINLYQIITYTSKIPSYWIGSISWV